MSVLEHLPGEPEHKGPPRTVFAIRVLLRLGGLVVIAIVAWPLWILYVLAALIWGWPPNVPRCGQVIRYLRLTWTVSPPAPGLRKLSRCWITLSVIRKVLLTPIWGLAWLLDEVLYGRALDAAPLISPLIEISAGRSGSTQLALYLEQDPRLAAPNLLQSLFPYLWLWRLAPRTIGRFITPEKVRRWFETKLPPEFLERHEGDPFRTDTFDAALYTGHLNHLSPFLGPDVMVEDFGFGTLAPHNRRLWEEDFVRLLDRIGRKTLVYAGRDPAGCSRRFFVKGHFLCAANALERQYPDACFLTMIREPAPRLRSAVNYLRVNPVDPMLGPVPWAWLGQALARTETEYCEIEQGWFTRDSGARRCVVRFSEFVGNLEATMTRVYRCCLGDPELPPHFPRTHAPRERTKYRVNRSLAEVGIDETAIAARLSSYIAWCKVSDENFEAEQSAVEGVG
jgi:hypothetical protein